VTTAHLGAAAACEQHVQALDVAVDDAYQCVVQVCKRARSLARSLDAVVGRGGGVEAQGIVPAAALHPLHHDEGVARFKAGAEDLHAVRVIHLHTPPRQNTQP